MHIQKWNNPLDYVNLLTNALIYIPKRPQKILTNKKNS